MKKYLSLLIVAIMLLSAFSVSSSAAGVLMENNHAEDSVLNPIANAQSFAGATAVDDLAKAENLSIAFVNASELTDLSAFLKACDKAKAIPTVVINSAAEADKLISAISSSKVRDINVVSSDAEALAKVRAKNIVARTGVLVDLQKSELTSKEASEIRKTVRSAPATFCVIKSENASKQAVAELQELAVAVWVQVESEPGTDAFIIEAVKAVTSGANGIISKDSALVNELINQFLAKNTMTRTPVMIGHRGNPTQAPENSLSGFITAYENGADIFEIDVEITADKEIIILHDNTLNRTTNYTGDKTVGKMKLSEIKEYKLLDKSGNVTDETVPTLRELLTEFKDKDCRIFVEFKGSNNQNVIETAKIVKEFDMEDRIDVISFNSKFLTQTQTSMPGMSTGYLCSYSFKSPTYKDAVTNMVRCLSDAQKCNSSINPAAGLFSVHFEQAATDRGITVWPWTYLASSNGIPYLAGCDGLTTDDVQWAKDMAKYVKTYVNEEDISVDGSLSISVEAVTYGGENIGVTDKSTITVITGSDCIKVENGEIIGVKEGNASVIFGYPTKTTDGAEYVLYTQPVSITVTAEAEGDASDNGDSDGSMGIIIAIIVCALGAFACAAAVIVKKKKK